MLVHLPRVQERVTLLLPETVEVVGVKARAGLLYLRITGEWSGELVERHFWAWDNGEYMMHPTLGCIDTVRLGNSIWFVFEE